MNGRSHSKFQIVELPTHRQGPDEGDGEKFGAGPVQLQQDAVLLLLLQAVRTENGRSCVQVLTPKVFVQLQPLGYYKVFIEINVEVLNLA